MPYKDPEEQRIYQRKWLARRKAEWFAANGPCTRCGSWNDLELDHINARLKVNHVIWSWSEKRRNAELAKCQVLCHPCHLGKTRQKKEHQRGEVHHKAKLSEAEVAVIKKRLARKESAHRIVLDYPQVTVWEIYKIKQGRTWA